ncbi:hypothetical protein CAPTEDRAFT_229248 [Capitella teleta]|uniref:Uncharacterized protein n=1 Tax=Capitella teleta TaxID=283909 RepID=R7V540_CAPTE|nr:hypothetical protein CAPTEDRAFT_229248 [Capitella teleta]|eukprot:ELU13577.1 hypothetical protein CAPTEDRAFT_229248 [Capitella teleta]
MLRLPSSCTMILLLLLVMLRDVFDRWILLQMLAIFCLSFGIGMLFMQGNILWHQYKYGYGYWASEMVTMEEVMKARVLSKISADPQVFQWSQGQLKVPLFT